MCWRRWPSLRGSSGVRGPELVIALVTVLALVSMANAGVLSSSRSPFAMSRDVLAPRLSDVGSRFETPVTSVLIMGGLLLVLIVAFPVRDFAKPASAFNILAFTFINVALIALRESFIEGYIPEFTSPVYPWVQGFGIIGGLMLLTQMGLVAIGGAVGIVLMGLL